MIPVNKIMKSGRDVRKMYYDGNIVRKSYRNGQILFQYVCKQVLPPPVYITSITFENVVWVNDISANGGTANKNNCSYQIIAHKSDGTTKDITSQSSVEGSLVVSASTTAVRQSAGTLTLTATYDALTANTNVVVYQLGNKIRNYTYYKALSAQSVSFTSGGTFYYTYNLATPYSAATLPIEFGTSGKETVFVAGNNSNPLGNAVFSTDAMVTMGGSINGLFTCFTTNTTFPSVSVKALYSGCTALNRVSADYLRATSVGSNGYESLFAGCSNLVQAPNLPATKLNFACYYMMFKDCTSLVNAPALSAANPTHSCYRQMFQGCTALTNAPALTATTVSKAAYCQMFSGCTSLVNAPALPATVLGIDCYQQMFKGCSNMVKAPELPASTLVQGCYFNMFEKCSKLNEIHCSATDISASACTYAWVQRVASAGTFYGINKNIWPIDSIDGVPVGWTPVFDNDITGLTFNNLTWTTDIPYSGGTATSANTNFSIIGTYRTGGTIDLTSACTVSGSQNVASSTILTRHSAGTLTLTATYNGVSVSKGVTIYQQACPNYITAITFSSLTWATDVSYSGGTATKSNCNYKIQANWANGNKTDVTSAATVSGSQSVASSTNLNRHSAGTLTLTATYSGKTASKGVTIYQEACPNYITSIAFSSLTWKTDIAATGGTADKSNCNYVIQATWSNGSKTNITSAATVSGSKSVSATTVAARHSAGTLTLTATYSGKTASKGVTIYQSGMQIVNFVKFYATASQSMTLPSGNFYYSYNGTNWSAVTGNVIFGTSGKQYVWIAGDNMSRSDSLGTIKFNTTATVTISSGDVSGLDNCTGGTLSAITKKNAYKSLFSGATAIDRVCNGFLPATRLKGGGCYSEMFEGCSNLIQAPILPATTLSDGCYADMFYFCTKLTGLNASNPTLPATSLAYGCYWDMFHMCTSLVNAPALPATTMAESCYRGMFYGCSSLVNAPTLPAMTLADYCYDDMFNSCTSLVTAPALPATTLVDYCYADMFYWCKKLENAPTLPATTLKRYCYQKMFGMCQKLNEIHCNATNISAEGCTNYWLSDVASTGDFYGKSAASWGTGVSGIPNGWTKHLS